MAGNRGFERCEPRWGEMFDAGEGGDFEMVCEGGKSLPERVRLGLLLNADRIGTGLKVGAGQRV